MDTDTGYLRNNASVKIEVCVDSVESALAAVRGGADRLEICANLARGGGTTPSLGLVRLIKQSCPEHIELMAMVRPRTGDFIYSQQETSVMLEDIKVFAGLGITGVVFGALKADGTIDVEKTKALIDEAAKRQLQVCFHRAFDMVVDQQEALAALRNIPGITRILTSGGKPSVSEGLHSCISLCNSLASSAIPNPKILSPAANSSSPDARIEIMPGSGIDTDTVGPILRALLPLGCRAVHLSGGGFVDSEMQYRPEGMDMGVGGAGEWGIWRTDESAVRKVKEITDKEWKAYAKGQTQ